MNQTGDSQHLSLQHVSHKRIMKAFMHLLMPLPLVLMVRRLSLGLLYSAEVLLPAPLRVCVLVWGYVQQHMMPTLVSAVSEPSVEDCSSVRKSDESFHSVGDDERKRRRDKGRKEGRAKRADKIFSGSHTCICSTLNL